MLKKLFLCIVLTAVIIMPMSASAFSPSVTSYTYNSMNDEIATPEPYAVERVLGTELGLKEPKDIQVSNGKIYVLDSGNQRIVVLDTNYNLESEITFKKDGKPYIAGELTSIWVENNTILVVDRVAEQIFRVDMLGNVLKVYSSPSNDASAVEKSFMPRRVVTDQTGYLYILLENEYRGLMVLTPEGQFMTYFGSVKVAATAEYIATSFWRNFMTEEQIEATSQYIPGGYNSITTDGKGFIYAVRGLSSQKTELVCKLNPGGENVLSYTGYFGDYNTISGSATQFKDIAVDKNGFISAIDIAANRIFQYTPDGELLYAFGGSGEQQGLFKTPAAIDYNGSDLLVLDTSTFSVTVFSSQKFGELIHKAVTLYSSAEFEEAGEIWKQVLSQNGNYELALIGLGKVAEARKDYTEALSYYRDGGSKQNYSSAFYKYRISVLRENFTYLVIGIIAVIFAISLVLRQIRKKKGLAVNSEYGSKVKYMFNCIRHPFDGFGELRYNRMGSVTCGVVVALVWFFVSCVNYNYNGYIFNSDNPEDFNMFIVFGSTVGIIFLLVLCNWLLSTFFEGKGTFKNLWIGVTYSLIPTIFCSLLELFFTNVLTLEEAFFVGALRFFGMAFSIALVFIATTRINQYNFTKNAVVLICSVLGILAIVFLAVLFINLWIQFASFCSSVYHEILYRIQVS